MASTFSAPGNSAMAVIGPGSCGASIALAVLTGATSRAGFAISSGTQLSSLRVMEDRVEAGAAGVIGDVAFEEYILPAAIGNPLYRLIAENRYRLGRRHCLLPSAEVRGRLIE